MAFQNNPPVTQIVLPSNGTPGAGGGATVIGGTLPQNLVDKIFSFGGQAGSGFVWYSLNNSYDYTFYTVDESQNIIYEGYSVGGVIRFTRISFSNLGSSVDTKLRIAQVNATSAPLPAQWDYDTETGNMNMSAQKDGDAYGIQVGGFTGLRLRKQGTSSYLTDSNDPTTDVWTGTFPGPGGTFNGGTYTSSYKYFVSFDRMVTINWNVSFSVQPTAGNLAIANFLPSGFVPIAGGGNIYGNGMDNQSSINAQKMTCRVDSGSRTMSIFTINATATSYSGSVTYPTAKPVF